MALNIPPIPNDQIGENAIWRNWFTRLYKALTSTTSGSIPVNHNALSAIQGGIATERYHLTAADVSKLAGIQAGAQVNNISDANAALLTGGGETSLHKHKWPMVANTIDVGEVVTIPVQRQLIVARALHNSGTLINNGEFFLL